MPPVRSGRCRRPSARRPSSVPMRDKHVSSARGGGSDPSGVAWWIPWYQRCSQAYKGGAAFVSTLAQIDLRIITMWESPARLTRAVVGSCVESSTAEVYVLTSNQIEASIRANPFRAHPDLKDPPRCRRCERPTSKRMVRPGNAIGNDGRPYYRCDHCEMFSCFGDMRGVHAPNPRCDCSPHRYGRAVLRKEWDVVLRGRAIRFRCAVGQCGFDEFGGPYKRHDRRLRVKDVIRAGL